MRDHWGRKQYPFRCEEHAHSQFDHTTYEHTAVIEPSTTHQTIAVRDTTKAPTAPESSHQL
jgi:hypothetical protein